ncbi:MAG: hypothetical protein ACQETE_06235 [Bacteroidota bacterium]
MIAQLAVGIGFLITFAVVIKSVATPGSNTSDHSSYVHGHGRTNPPRPE